MLVTLAIAGIIWLSAGIAGCFSGSIMGWYVIALQLLEKYQLTHTNNTLSLYRYVGASMIVIVFVCDCGVWPASVVVASETSSLRLRRKTQGVGFVIHGLASGVFNIVIPYMFNPDEGDLGAKIVFIFATLCAGSVQDNSKLGQATRS